MFWWVSIFTTTFRIEGSHLIIEGLVSLAEWYCSRGGCRRTSFDSHRLKTWRHFTRVILTCNSRLPTQQMFNNWGINFLCHKSNSECSLFSKPSFIWQSNKNVATRASFQLFSSLKRLLRHTLRESLQLRWKRTNMKYFWHSSSLLSTLFNIQTDLKSYKNVGL